MELKEQVLNHSPISIIITSSAFLERKRKFFHQVYDNFHLKLVSSEGAKNIIRKGGGGFLLKKNKKGEATTATISG